MKCPVCNSEIDNRSLYCDQCGTKLPEKSGSSNAASKSNDDVIWEILDLIDDVQSPNQPAASVAKAATRLVCSKYGLEIPLYDGAVIGRTSGNYVSVFGQCTYVSGRHAQLTRTQQGWSITDLGSTNGTTVNGIPCRPTLSFNTGDKVCLAVYYEFTAI